MKKLKVLITAVALIISLFLLVSPFLVAYASKVVKIEDNFPTAAKVLEKDIEKEETLEEDVLSVSAGIATVLDEKEIKDSKTEKIEEDVIISTPRTREVVKEKPKNIVSIGTYKLTAYCSCEKCCGKWSQYNKTASGTTPEQGRTVACNSLSFGTRLLINGEDYIVEDTGNMSNNVIDIYFYSHEEALEFGVRNAEVFKILD